MDIVVTVPMKELDNVRAEDDYARSQDGRVIQFWSVSRQPKAINIGDKVYFIEDGYIRYYHTFLGFDCDSICKATGRVWPGLNLVLAYPETPLKNPVPMKGFQGFRYIKSEDLGGENA